MKEIKAILIIKALTPDEFKNFGKFIESPYHNSSKNVIKLYNILKKYYPDFDNRALEITKVFKKMYPGDKYHEGNIRNLISEMGQLAESFLSFEFYKTQDHIVKTHELIMLRHKNIPVLKDKLLNTLLAKYGKAKTFIEPYSQEGILLNNFKAFDQDSSEKGRRDSSAYSRRSEFAALFAIEFMTVSRLNVYVNEYNHNDKYPDLMAKMYDAFNFEEFLEYAKLNSPQLYKVIAIQYYLVEISLGRNVDENSFKFEKLFYENCRYFSKEYLYSLFNTLSVSYQVIVNGEQDRVVLYAKKLLKLYSIFLKRKLYKIHGPFIGPQLFITMVKAASLADDYEWIRKFISGYKDELRPEDKNDILNCSIADYNVGIKNYAEALNYYSKVEKPSLILSFTIKLGMMRCHYFLENYETAWSVSDAYIRSFERHFKGNKSRTAELHYVKLFQKLLKVVTSANLKGLGMLEFEVKKALPRIRIPLLKMINSLKQNK